MRMTLIIISAILILSGCSEGLKRKVGLAREAPNEQAVQTIKPLVIPKDFSLPKPIERGRKSDMEKHKYKEQRIPSPLEPQKK